MKFLLFYLVAATALLLTQKGVEARLPRILSDFELDEGVPVLGNCEFRVNGDLNDPAPLFSRHDAYELIVPEPTDTVRLANGELLDMFCTNADGFAAPFEKRQRVTAQCLQQQYFLVDGLIYPFGNFSCADWPSYIARRTGRPCNGGTDLVQVGFEVEDGGFLHSFDVCHDERAEATRYVHHVLYPSSYDYQHGVARPSWIGTEQDFYGDKNVNTIYTQVQQNLTISDILGLDASPYFNFTEDRYLARGHLIAKTDQIFGAPQHSTFLFINVAPQWQSFNGGNWEKVESSVRKFVADRHLTTDCYTGTWGVSTLPDVDGVERELYLDFDVNDNGLIPVPKIYFRVVIDRESREGIVLVGVNNRYASLEQIRSDYILCEDVGHRLSWLNWIKEDLHEGYSYACSVEDFIAVVKDLPLEDLHTNGVLGLDDEVTTTEGPTTEPTTPTTEPPTTTTEEPTSTTEPTTPTTEPPTTTTEEPTSTTEPTTPTTEPPTTTTEEPTTTTETTTPTEPPTTTTEEPTTTEPPTSTTTTEPTTTTEEPTTTTEPTTPTTEAPSTTSEATTTTTEEPTSTTEPTTPTTEAPSTTTTEEPTSTTAPTTSTEAPTSTPAEPPTSSTSAPTPTPTPTGPPGPNCDFDINRDLSDPAPLFTPLGALSWLLPDSNGLFRLDEGESIELHCTGALRSPFNKFTALTARCLGNGSLLAEGLTVDSMKSFRCQSWPTYEAQRTGQSCEGGTEMLRIGFELAAGHLPLLELCYDEQNQTTRNVRYELTPANLVYQLDVAQPGYLRGGFFAGHDVNELYSQSHQLDKFSQLLSLDASIYFDSSRDLYLVRGQLAPRLDFVHGSAQRATHFYVNAAPQWRSINKGNWQSIERSLREYVADQGLNVSVHAGSWGVATLPDTTGVQRPLYLGADAEGEGQLPVPRLHYRIAIDQESREGIALIVVNQPHATLAEILSDYVICEDVGAHIDWLDWNKSDLLSGYAYACSVDSFTDVVRDLPLTQLETTGLLGLTSRADASCSFRINGDLKDPAPLYVQRDKAGVARWLEPNLEGMVQLRHGEQLELHCGATRTLLAPFAQYRRLELVCHEQQLFVALGSVYNLNDFVCSGWPSYVARKTGRSCNGGTDLAEAGFELNTSAENSDFLQVYDVCHDEKAEATRYVHHVLYPGSAQYQRSVTRPTFVTGGFYDNKNVNTMYTQVQQQLTVGKILGGDVSHYFNTSSDLYMARGHLAAKTDFVFGAPQKATFFFINVAPQWQSFNGGNWERVEDSVRKFVADEQLTVDCYTGTWGISTLPDVEGVPRELYLNFDENNNGLIPVPMIYFRVVIDRESRKGIVLVGVNNPHASLKEILSDYVICDDISDQLSWVSWTKDNIYRGYSYACTVESFTAVVQDLPLEDLRVEGVLGVSTTTY